VTGLGDLGRGGAGAARATTTAIQVINHRTWLEYLRHESLLRALNVNNEELTPRLQEAVRTIAEILDDTPLPFEPTRGLMVRATRIFKEKFSRGIRYPDHEGAARQTFWERLYWWTKEAAESPAGQRALAYAGFLDGDAHIFATRMVGATYEVLLLPFYKNKADRFRVAMADELNYGLTEEQRAERRRHIQIIVRSITAGLAATAVGYIGFNDDWLQSMGLGIVALTATAAADVVHGGLTTLTGPMRAARKQAQYWLRSLSALLVAFLQATDKSLRLGAPGDVGTLVKVLKAMTSEEVRITELPGQEQLLRGLGELQATADRVGDSALITTLIEIETAIKFEPSLLPDSVGRLLILIQAVPDDRGPTTFRSMRGARLSQLEQRQPEATPTPARPAPDRSLP
jgi:hypothetical protein